MTDSTPTHAPLPYECFQDRSYYDMWCVRRVNEREWGNGFHLVNGEEAAALRDLLNARELVDALRGLLDEIGRSPCADQVLDSAAAGKAFAALAKAGVGHG